MKLIVGLGNPEKKYDNTRHNVGFMILDNYLNGEIWQEKFNALYIKKNINEEVVYFIKPLTYVNLSGLALKQYVNYFNIDIKDILVIHDDLDIEIGKYKLKRNSSSGGHNGIKSIIKELNTDAFLRLKIGIKNNDLNDIIDFVLGKFKSTELELINNKIYLEIINSFIKNGIEKTMNIYNKK
ncbi:MAG: aminoacyl-tRNA hydrolase [Firmicutes bacterium]|nr:aminoacyl-tRNA hydrolase [Bacillota bacterium]